MAQKIEPANLPEGRIRPFGGGLKTWIAVALLGGALVPIAGTLRWRSHRQMQRMVAALPPVPDLGGKPPMLSKVITAAATRTQMQGGEIAATAELARLYHANGYRAEAEACWRILQARQPKEARWIYYLADLRKTAGDYQEMRMLLGEVIKRAPDYAPAWLQLGDQSFKTGDVVAAERYYRRRLALMPGDAYARFGLARVAFQAGRLDEARREIAGIVRDAPDFPSSHNLYAEMLAAEGDQAGAARERQLGAKAGRFREAEDPWLEELQRWCFDPKRLFVLGTIDYQVGRRDRALACFQRAVELDPEAPETHEMLGDLYLKLGQPANARDALEQSLRLPASLHRPAIIFVMLSQAYRDLRQPEQALAAADRGLEKSGDAAELHNARGAALADMGRHVEAVAAYRESIRLNANDTEANFNLGASLLTLGKAEEGVKCLKQALLLQPRFVPALALLGRIEMDSGRLATAAEYLRPLHEANPDLPQARQLLVIWNLQAGSAAEKQQDAAAAERYYRDGLALVPENPELNVNLGALLLISGRFAEALAPLERLREVRPDDPQAALYLGQAYAALGRTADARRVLSDGVGLAERIGNTVTAAYCREILGQL